MGSKWNRFAGPRAASLLAVLVLAALARAEDKKAPPPGPAVAIDAGKVRGHLVGADKDIVAYKGIPYAKPPVGDLRWREPQPPEKWEGVRDCFQFGNACLQRGDAMINVIPQLRLNANQSEDCLYLNVWGPAKSGAKLPVLVWIHGGGYTTGAASQPLYDGESLARKGAVVVTLNYRLGPFGFLAHPALTKESEHHASGNYGLLDQIEALRWVKRNAAAFGGDPERVAIFGESAGGGSVVCLMVSPLARGLFQGAIAQSPGGLDLARLKEGANERSPAEQLGAEVMTRCRLAADADAAALRKVAANDVLRNAFGFAQPRGAAERFGAWVPSLGPIVDGYVITDTPRAVFAAGKECPVPFIIGHTRDEESLFVNQSPLPMRTDEYRRKIDNTFGAQAATIASFYPAAADKDIRDAGVRLLTDMRWAAPVRQAARMHSSKGYPTYRYVFSRGLKQPPFAQLGAHHGCELAYIFGAPGAGDGDGKKVVELMQGYWVNFAARGDPNGDGLAKWPKFASGADALIEIESGADVREHYHEKQLDAMDAHSSGAKTGAAAPGKANGSGGTR
jgi:para-nitrobenzyl esterase